MRQWLPQAASARLTLAIPSADSLPHARLLAQIIGLFCCCPLHLSPSNQFDTVRLRMLVELMRHQYDGPAHEFQCIRDSQPLMARPAIKVVPIETRSQHSAVRVPAESRKTEKRLQEARRQKADRLACSNREASAGHQIIQVARRQLIEIRALQFRYTRVFNVGANQASRHVPKVM